jgi:hypothetical protein
MATLDDVQTEVTAQTDVVASAVTLLGGLKTALDAAIASGNPAAVQAISDALGANSAALAAAVTANTPAVTP